MNIPIVELLWSILYNYLEHGFSTRYFGLCYSVDVIFFSYRILKFLFHFNFLIICFKVLII